MYVQTKQHRTEVETLNQAIDALAEVTGLQLRVDEREVVKGENRIDAILTIDGRKYRLAAEVKRWAAQANIGALINTIKALLPMQGVLVADYINPKMAEKLREQNVQFIDTAGNAYLDMPPLYVQITGRRKIKQDVGGKGDGNRAFDRKGLTVIFAFLCRPDLVNAPYREIADVTGVALGTVGWVITGLKDAGYIFEYGNKKERELVEYKRLLDRWVETYPEKLRPKVHIGDFQAEDPNWWKDFDIQEYNGYWGGEIAAAHYTKYLKPAVATVYLPKKVKSKLLARARLRAAPENMHEAAGRVRCFQTFWHEAAIPFLDTAKPGLVPPVLAYADLIATADPRNLEVAGRLYDEYIAQYSQKG